MVIKIFKRLVVSIKSTILTAKKEKYSAADIRTHKRCFGTNERNDIFNINSLIFLIIKKIEDRWCNI